MISLFVIIAILASFISMVLLCWFNSDTILEYGKLLGLENQLKLNEYKLKKVSFEGNLSYPIFLKMSNSGFFVKLITCPICLTVWLVGILGLFLTIWVGLFLSIWLAIMILLTLPITCVSTLILYGTIIKLLRLQ